ncbi:hypothetical protein [uncultured Jannaschia sp.]|uniref:hypothetical protein n=1 Tax=uncultured Jannaschia sp. TaxID=293347 RepID=UPI002602D144|nr:hypothetical protein [uncultured Jannaschia sp.]
MATIYPTRTAPSDNMAGTVARVSWGAIFAGGAVAVALMILFTTFGIGIGAAILDPQYDAAPGSGLGIGSGLYLIVTQLIALGAGGFVAARLAGIPRTIASLLHGTAVWSVATIFLAWAAVTGAGAMFGAASSVLEGTATAIGDVGEAIVPDDLSLPNPSDLAGSISLDALPEELQTTLREKGVTEANIRQESVAAFRDVFSQEEQDAALAEMRTTLGDVLQDPANAGTEIADLFDRLVGGEDAIVSDDDRQQAMSVLEQRLGITPDEAEGIVQSVEDGIRSSVDSARDGIEAARETMVETAQAASDAISTTALLLALASLLGLAAACGGAFAGKPDDADDTDLRRQV